jgi:hypothetical protein
MASVSIEPTPESPLPRRGASAPGAPGTLGGHDVNARIDPLA